MKTRLAPAKRALTLTEVLVIVAGLLLVLACLLPMLARSRAKSPRINCVENLKQVGLALRIWPAYEKYQMRESVTNAGSMEWAASGEVWPHFLVMSNELQTPKVLVCPADTRDAATSWASFSNTNISYFIGLDADETQPQMLLTGDSNLEVDGQPVGPGLLVLQTNSAVGWTDARHQRQGYVALADGSVQQYKNAKLREALARTGVATNRLAIP